MKLVQGGCIVWRTLDNMRSQNGIDVAFEIAVLELLPDRIADLGHRLWGVGTTPVASVNGRSDARCQVTDPMSVRKTLR